MMQATKLWNRDNPAFHIGSAHRFTSQWRFLRKRKMSPVVVVVADSLNSERLDSRQGEFSVGENWALRKLRRIIIDLLTNRPIPTSRPVSVCETPSRSKFEKNLISNKMAIQGANQLRLWSSGANCLLQAAQLRGG